MQSLYKAISADSLHYSQCYWPHGSNSLLASLHSNILLTFKTYRRGKSHDLLHQEAVHHWILSKGNVNDDTEMWLTIFHKYKWHLPFRICFLFTVGSAVRGDILTLVCLHELLIFKCGQADSEVILPDRWEIAPSCPLMTEDFSRLHGASDQAPVHTLYCATVIYMVRLLFLQGPDG